MANNRTAQAFAATNSETGENFSNNLFTDLAPLLTLFGEQVTKQFMSQAMGWADNILLGMAPIGILTSVVSAIRVGGRRWLKALIGRARESRPAAETELLSSTSDSVCELWSGKEIVRDRGNPQTKELIYKRWDKSQTAEDVTDMVYDLSVAHKKGVYRAKGLPDSTDNRRKVAELTRQAPNLTLNVPNALPSRFEVRAFACIGVMVQLLILVASALTTYYWKLRSGGSAIAAYGYPCYFIGTLLLSFGTITCSHIIEGSTDELEFMPTHSSKDFKVVRIQRACIVSEQQFPSFAIFNASTDMTIRTSRLNEKSDYSFLAAVATGISLIGYIIQFIGLRAMHWTSAISTLIGTLLMTAIRSLVRRGLAKDPDNIMLHEGLELSWLAYEVMGLGRWELLCGSYERDSVFQPYRGELRHLLHASTPLEEKDEPTSNPQVFRTVEVRAHIHNLVMWHDDVNVVSSQLATAICQVMRIVSSEAATFLDDEPVNPVGGLGRQRAKRRFLGKYAETNTGSRVGQFDRRSDSTAESVGRENFVGLGEDILSNQTAKLIEEQRPSLRSIEEESHTSMSIVEGISRRGRYRVRRDDKVKNIVEPAGDESSKSRFKLLPGRVSFEWENDVIYRSSTVGSADMQELYKFTVDSGLLDTVRGEDVQWYTDIDTLVAVVSLWLYTITQRKEHGSARVGYLRLLGDAKDIWVTTSAHRHKDGEEEAAERVRDWAKSVENEGNDPNENTQSAAGVPVDAESHPGEDELQGGIDSHEGQGDYPGLTKESIEAKDVQNDSNIRKSMRGGMLVEEWRTNAYALWVDRGVNSHQVEFPNGQKDRDADDTDSGPHDYPVFGYTVSAFMREKREHPNIPPLPENGDTELHPPRRQSTWKHPGKTERAVVSSAPLEKLCAQEIFANFLFALTAYFKRLKRASKARLDFEGASGDELRWSNPMITKLAQAVESSGLANYEEAYMLVVPPFYARDLLPTSYSKKHRGTISSYSYSDYTSTSSQTRITRHSSRH